MADSGHKHSILFVSDTGGFTGGVERFVYDTAGQLQEAGWRVGGIFGAPGRDQQEFNKHFDRVYTFAEVETALQEGDYDFAFVHKVSSPELLRKVRLGLPTAVYVHDHDYYCLRRHKYFPFRRINCKLKRNRLYCTLCGSLARHNGKFGCPDAARRFEVMDEIKRCDCFLVMSEFMRGNLLKNGFQARRIHKLYTVLELGEVSSEAERLKIPEIMCAGQLIRGKGVDLLLKAVTFMRNECRVVIVGDGKDMDYLKGMAKSLRIEDKVEFAGWQSDLDKYWRRASLAVFPSRWQEPFGMTGIEAFAYGLPVAGFDVGGVTEWLHDGINGLIARAGSPRSLAAAMDKLLDVPDIATRLGVEGRQFVKENFGRQRFIKRMEEIAFELGGIGRRQLKIFFSAMAYDGGRSGVSVYINNVLRELAVKHRVDVLAFPEDMHSMPRSANLNYEPVSLKLEKPVINMLWHLFWLPFTIPWKEYDFILLPAANRRAFLFYRNFTVAVVHDLSQYHIPAKYDLFRMFYIKKILPRCVRRASRLVAVSKSTGADLQEYWRVPKEHISVIYNGYDRTNYNPKPEAGDQQVMERYNLQKPYILYISRIEHPGKNHYNLIKAFELLPEKLRLKYDLVLGGDLWTGSEVVKEYVSKSVCRKSIKFIGFVNSPDVAALYRRAQLYVFPSLFEGFGLSLVEAMACGTPVACSKTSSLGEIGGDAAVLFDPESPESIAESMRKVLEDNEVAEVLVEAGLKRARDFDWEKHARELVEVYENAKIRY